MQLRGIEFGNAFCSSGARNFTGKGWWYHSFFRLFGLNYAGSTLITKTVTLNPREGNMPLREDGLTPRDRFPDCVVVRHWKGIALNAVGLSNFGSHWLLNHPALLEIKQPFIISFMSMESEPSAIVAETHEFVRRFRMAYNERRFEQHVAIQLNLSCPNTEHGQAELLGKARYPLDALRYAPAPIIVKFNVEAAPETVARIAEHPGVDAICVSNTIPWGRFPDRIDWAGLFGVPDASSTSSPLKKYNGGGLSGKPLLPFVEEWVTEARPLIDKPIMAGGGVLCKDDADRLIAVGANAIELGAISMLRPWRVQGVITRINQRFQKRSVS